jgi:hypothetical protein
MNTRSSARKIIKKEFIQDNTSLVSEVEKGDSWAALEFYFRSKKIKIEEDSESFVE